MPSSPVARRIGGEGWRVRFVGGSSDEKRDLATRANKTVKNVHESGFHQNSSQTNVCHHDVIKAVRSRSVDFMQNASFNEIMRTLKKDPNIARTRLLNPRNPKCDFSGS